VHRTEKSSDRAFAVRAGYVHDFERLLGVAELVAGLPHGGELLSVPPSDQPVEAL
jgi:hypothetical protein